MAHGERAEDLNPDDADAKAVYSGTLACVGRGADALERIETALRLSPFPPSWYMIRLAVAYLSLGRFEEAIAAYLVCLRDITNWGSAHLGLTLAYMELGREEEGRAQARQLLRILPNFSSSLHPRVTSFADPATRERYTALLVKAGLPE